MTKRGSAIGILGLVVLFASVASCTSPYTRPPGHTASPPAISLPPPWTPTSPNPPTSGPSITPVSGLGLDLPSQWPFATLTRDQLLSAIACSSIAQQSYGDSALIPPDETQSNEDPADPCSSAHHAYRLVLATEYWEVLPNEGIEDYRRAVEANPAFIFHDDLFYGYFGAIQVAEAPPVADQPITSLKVHYSWGGLGSGPIEYFISIANAQSQPQTEITFEEGQHQSDPLVQLEPSDVQALAQSLTDFVPVPQMSTLLICTDNYPDWTVELTFLDGSTISLVTNGSNLLGIGGPWQATIDGSLYMQISSAFANALGQLITTMEMPLGEPAAMFCFQVPVIQTIFGLES